MKQFLATFAMLFSLLCTQVFAQAAADTTSHGVRAKVELVTGTTQYAQFLGFAQDTVLLGGNIQGKFTIVRITRNRFKSIVDDAGNDLLNPTPKPELTPAADTTNSDTLAKIPTFLDSVAGQTLFVALERRSIDSALDAQVTPIVKQMLKESGHSLKDANRTDFGYCRELACIRDSLRQYGATAAYLGRILGAQSQDSLVLQLSYVQFNAATQANAATDSIKADSVITAQVTLSALHGLTSAIEGNKIAALINTLEGKATKASADSAKAAESTAGKAKSGASYVKVETDPEGSIIAIDGKGDICKSPCTFAVKDTAKFDIYAYWSVNGQMWATKKAVHPVPGDTAKFSLKLKKSKPMLRVFTIPEGATLYAGSATPTPSTAPDGKSPKTFEIFEPGMSYLQIRKVGYRDTTVAFYASPTDVTDLNITLKPLTAPAEIEQQKAWAKAQRNTFIGNVLMGSSIAPIIAGAILVYLANSDYDDAKQIKNELSYPAAQSGSNYNARVSKNHDLVHKGDRKLIAGGSLIGVGVIMLGVGFTLTF